MSNERAEHAAVVLTSEFSPLRLELDARSGLPVALTGEGRRISMQVGLEVITAGEEEVPPLGGLAYVDTISETDVVTQGEATQQLSRDAREFHIPISVGATSGALIYTFRASHPRLSLQVRIDGRGTDPVVLRDVVVTVRPEATSAEPWRLHAPGNRIRTDLPLASLTRELEVSPPGGLLGSSGIVALELVSEDDPLVALFWPFPTNEIGTTTVSPSPDGPRIIFDTDLAAVLSAGQRVHTGAIHLDLVPERWETVIDSVPDWLEELGVRTPSARASWAAGANIFEAQIGFSVFAGGWRYSPYPEPQDLIADLDRIADLGFNTIQLMPRHPFPSYNVYDYSDVSTSWGESGGIRSLVDECHHRGMRIIFDILMHGVVDRESVKRAADAVRSGPYATRLDEATTPLWRGGPDNFGLAFSRHLIDFEQYWSEPSAQEHPLIAAHPDWFARLSDGTISGIYSKAFDVSHPEWQDYFIDACERLVMELGIDGFRFDAPIFNNFANWTPRAQSHASANALASIPLFRRMRRRLRAISPEILLYTEPSGVLHRLDMDVNYNYDEQWLFGALFDDTPREDQEAITGESLGRWLSHRNRCVPKGSLTAHHIDSHDTFWWGLPGSKWFREIYSAGHTRALTQIFALSGGPFMMFVGGEGEIESLLGRVLRLRAERPEFSAGEPTWGDVSIDTDSAYAVTMRTPEASSLVVVNTTDEELTVEVALHDDVPDDWTAHDILNEHPVEVRRENVTTGLRVTLPPFAGAAIPLSTTAAGASTEGTR
ncbi:alpha amylase catalytic subunit [Microbacterium sp. SLBN-154]|uniref:alpha-amylase family glycosyl hydrolase n=1 Tax=Microbacterium sp. SLBN-154 TaxID=2768458 RepID=UPI001153663E|nr:alpha-amylase family glycosyl hydrolase [Microbacterium sp. SLBN-154]TQK17647.1 alpha amylase catalytic subunit [Microbacterium sp. SLBN-154]